MPSIATDPRTERALAADIIVDLLHAKYLPMREDAIVRVRDLFGLTVDEVREAAERHAARHKRTRDLSGLPYTYADGTVSFDDVPDTFAAPAPAPSGEVERAPRPAAKGPSPLALRFGVSRDGFMLPDGTYVGYLAATADQHRERSQWLIAATEVVAAAAAHHRACADAITAAGVTCLAQLAENDRPSVPELTP